MSENGAVKRTVTPEPPSSPIGGRAPSPTTARKERKEKERMFLFMRLLMRHLERCDATLHAAARAQIKECYAQRTDAVTLQVQLRATVGEGHWQQARDDEEHLILKQRMTSQPRRGDLGVPPPSPSVSRAAAVARRHHLLLLRHASECEAEDGRCAVEPRCAATKALWTHIRGCRDSKCPVPLCLASRFLMSHYRRCRGPCAVCVPVKELVRNDLEAKRKTKKPRRAPHADTDPPSSNRAGGAGTAGTAAIEGQRSLPPPECQSPS